MILEYFKNYVKKIGNTTVSTLREGDEILRCRDDDDIWKDCPPNYSDVVAEYEEQQKTKMKEENPYGIMGKYNPETKKFCIVDFVKEEQSKARIKKKKKGMEMEDTRANNPGKVCGGGWRLPELITIMVKRLKADPPASFQPTKIKDRFLANKYMEKIFTSEEVAVLSEEDMRRALYWSTEARSGGKRGIKPICTEMKKWFEGHNLLENDNQCGIQGKIKGVKKKKTSTARTYRIERIVPSDNKERFRENKAVAKLMKDCFKIDKYRHEINDDTWVMAYLKKLAGFIVLRKGKIIRACVAGNYRREDIPRDVMKRLTEFSNVNTIVMDNREKNYMSTLRRYKTYGFAVTKDDGKTTILEYS